MASPEEVKQYIAYWLQLGKRVLVGNAGEILLAPQSIIKGNRYSQEFEKYWQKIISPEIGECYLEGTRSSIKELLSPNWDIVPCARCQMPVALIHKGIQVNSCPCSDLGNWPNTELPKPRSPIDNSIYLKKICLRLNKSGEWQRFARQRLRSLSKEGSE